MRPKTHLSLTISNTTLSVSPKLSSSLSVSPKLSSSITPMTLESALIIIHGRHPNYDGKNYMLYNYQLKPSLTTNKHDLFLSYLALSLSALCSFLLYFTFAD